VDIISYQQRNIYVFLMPSGIIKMLNNEEVLKEKCFYGTIN
jgi:hypothetical protein